MCDFNYWELEQIDSVFDTLYSNIPSGESPDRLSGNGNLDDRSYYEALQGSCGGRFP